jgi:hypothetical protein
METKEDVVQEAERGRIHRFLLARRDSGDSLIAKMVGLAFVILG